MAQSALRALKLELQNMIKEPLEGFVVKLVEEDNLFEWAVAIFGPPATLYEGGYFKAVLKFPTDYPYSPPTMRFQSKMFHPNVYENGDLCISILHPPIDDPHSGELPCERWNPTQNVRTILLSVISLLNEPNTSSPANVDASVMFRRWKESKGADDEYKRIIAREVEASKVEATKDGVRVPTTLEEYCVKQTTKPKQTPTFDDFEDNFYDYYGVDDDDDEGEASDASNDSMRAQKPTTSTQKPSSTTTTSKSTASASGSKPTTAACLDDDSGQGDS